MALEPHSTFGFSLLLSGSDCPLCSVLFLVDSLTSLSCIYAAFCSGGRRHLLAPPGKDEKNFMYQKNDDCHNHRLCVLYVEMPYAFSHRFLSFRWFVGLLTYPFMCGEFFSHKRIVSAFSLSHDSSSNDRFSSHARFALHGNNPLEIQLLFKSYLSLALAEKADSFRVRDSHPIPLFSEQACVSD